MKPGAVIDYTLLEPHGRLHWMTALLVNSQTPPLILSLLLLCLHLSVCLSLSVLCFLQTHTMILITTAKAHFSPTAQSQNKPHIVNMSVSASIYMWQWCMPVPTYYQHYFAYNIEILKSAPSVCPSCSFRSFAYKSSKTILNKSSGITKLRL